MTHIPLNTMLGRDVVARALQLPIEEVTTRLPDIRWATRAPLEDVATIRDILRSVKTHGGDAMMNASMARSALTGAATDVITSGGVVEAERSLGKLGAKVALIAGPLVGVALLARHVFAGGLSAGASAQDAALPEPAPANSPTSTAPAPAPAAIPAPTPTPMGPNKLLPAFDASHGPVAATRAALEGVSQVDAIDVSHYQRTIDWNAVRQANVPIAYLKAIEGHEPRNNDETYERNRRDATAAGVITGAYDYAHPGTGYGGLEENARSEARRFIETAGVRMGDLVPMLDLEEHGGLSSDDLATWVRIWGEEVTAATGERPALYTYPAFWKQHLAGHEELAKQFHLYIADYRGNKDLPPRVPEGLPDWAMYQYTGTGSIAGIVGDVDLDIVRDPSSLIIDGVYN